MRYAGVVKGRFISRPNRFIAVVEVGGAEETVHVKNTGRCRELLIPGSEVWLTAPGTPGRKTRYDLIAVRKQGGDIFNIDSQAPNRVMREWLEMQDFDRVIPEFTFGSSRIDFCMEKKGVRYLLEVKGCTLEIGGIGYFPDAPTERGVKHLRELIRAAGEGFKAAVGFVIQTEGVREVRPNTDTHPQFAEALKQARSAGVRILFFPCRVRPDSLEIIDEIES